MKRRLPWYSSKAQISKISAMAWIKGYWTGEGYGGTIETLMGPPKAGVMIAMRLVSRTVIPSQQL